MTLTRKELHDMRVEARMKIEKEFNEFRMDFMERDVEIQRRGQLAKAADDVVREAAEAGAEVEDDDDGYQE